MTVVCVQRLTERPVLLSFIKGQKKNTHGHIRTTSAVIIVMAVKLYCYLIACEKSVVVRDYFINRNALKFLSIIPVHIIFLKVSCVALCSEISNVCCVLSLVQHQVFLFEVLVSSVSFFWNSWS